MEKVLTKKIDAKQEAIERHAVGDRKIHGKDLDRNESPDGDERSEDEDFSGNEDFPQHSEKNWDREYSDESDFFYGGEADASDDVSDTDDAEAADAAGNQDGN